MNDLRVVVDKELNNGFNIQLQYDIDEIDEKGILPLYVLSENGENIGEIERNLDDTEDFVENVKSDYSDKCIIENIDIGLGENFTTVSFKIK